MRLDPQAQVVLDSTPEMAVASCPATVFHAFFGMGALIDRANDAVDEACAVLRAALAS